MNRAQKVEIAFALRQEGASWSEVAEIMGAKPSTVRSWYNDPDLSKQNARRERYAGTCVVCGAKTDGSDGPNRRKYRCKDHLPQNDVVWTQEMIVLAVKRFFDRYGVPPSAPDFNPSKARALGHVDRVETFYRDGDYPHVATVLARFPSWNDAIRAAGLDPLGVGKKRRPRRVVAA